MPKSPSRENAASDIERSYVVPSRQELAKIEAALMDLIRAKHRIKAVAAECGWPGEVKDATTKGIRSQRARSNVQARCFNFSARGRHK